MFKQFYGFDVNILKRGEPIFIYDCANSRFNGRYVIKNGDENKTGAYLINESSPTFLKLTAVNGNIVQLFFEDFLGENPRMEIKLYKKIEEEN